ncbi:MAG: hypothetical protein ACYSWP_24195, partial [Planctomycetota bacterium]
MFGFWPPEYINHTPLYPSTTDVVSITVGGEWGDSCIPNGSAISVVGNNIYFDVVHEYPPDVFCLTVIMGWQEEQFIGPLPSETYSVYVGLTEYSFIPPFSYTYMSELIVTDKQFVVSTESLSVNEGATATFTVALLKDPCETVHATVAYLSGDSDITVESGALLTFDSNNYSDPHVVTIAAAEDDDYLSGETLIQISAAEYLTSEVTASEIDDELPFVLYVDKRANGNNDGSTWTDAFTDLQEALSIAAAYPEIEEIRVAQGVYTPTEANGNRSIRF